MFVVLPAVRLVIFLILSLSKDAGNHPARSFAEDAKRTSYINRNDENNSAIDETTSVFAPRHLR